MKVSSLIVEILANQLIIPYQIHTNMLPLLIKADTFLVQFRKRIAKFLIYSYFLKILTYHLLDVL